MSTDIPMDPWNIFDITYCLVSNGGAFHQALGIAVDSAGDVFVTNIGTNTIEERLSGSTTWKDITDGQAFQAPYGIAVGSTGNLFVANYGNGTIDEYFLMNAVPPRITVEPDSVQVGQGAKSSTLSVSASSGDFGNLSVQWYRNTTDSNTSGTAITGATSTSYIPPSTTVGTMYYYVVVTNTNNSVNGNNIATTTSSAIPVIVTASSTDTLSSLTISKGLLSPAFTSQVTSYTDQVDNSVNSIALTPTVTDPTKSVTVSVYGNPVSFSNGSYNVPLQVGDNPITVKVLAQDGTSQTYTVDVDRKSTPITGQLPEVPFAAGLPLLGLAGAGVAWFTRGRKGKQS